MDLPVLDGERPFAAFFAHNPIDFSFVFLLPAKRLRLTITTQPAATTTTMGSTCSKDSDFYKSSKPTTAVNLVYCSIIGSDDKFKLICWLLGMEQYPFAINIKTDGIIGDLAAAIKKKVEELLVGVDCQALEIWKVNTSRHVLLRTSDILKVIPTHSFYGS